MKKIIFVITTIIMVSIVSLFSFRSTYKNIKGELNNVETNPIEINENISNEEVENKISDEGDVVTPKTEENKTENKTVTTPQSKTNTNTSNNNNNNDNNNTIVEKPKEIPKVEEKKKNETSMWSWQTPVYLVSVYGSSANAKAECDGIGKTYNETHLFYCDDVVNIDGEFIGYYLDLKLKDTGN